MIIPIERTTDTAEARRPAAAQARELGYDEDRAGRVSIVATELATNIVKHADKGELVVQPYRLDPATHGLELIAIDSGPGIADLARARADGFSTAGSPGTGLGAIQRIADEVSVYTQPGRGTVMLARLAPPRGRGAPTDTGFALGAMQANCPGEVVCGDAWSAVPARNRCRLLVVDGSGHGPPAAEAARAAVALFEAKPGLGLVEIMMMLHGGLAHTRGASAGVLEINRDTREVTFAGLGNISTVVITTEGRRGMISPGGTLGHTWRTVRPFSQPFAGGAATVVMHSDGLATRWQLDGYLGLAACHPSVIAAVLYRDFHRERDDVTVVVVKVKP